MTPGYPEARAEDDGTVPPVTQGSEDEAALRALMIGDRIPAGTGQQAPITSPAPSYETVAPWMTTDADLWSEFSDEERATAQRLRGYGVELHSVYELDRVLPPDVTERRGPDAVLVGTRRTVEMKTAEQATVNALKSLARKGRTQSRIVVLDGTDVGVSRGVAEQSIRAILGQYGNDLDLLAILLGGGSGVHWTHG